MGRLALALALAYLSAIAADARAESVAVPPDDRLRSLREELALQVEKGELTSLAVGVIENGRVLWCEAFGWADREARIPASPNTRYGVASLGKSIAATAAMTLVERGQLRLDAPLPDILKQETPPILIGRRPPTVRQLFNMTAGIPHGAVTVDATYGLTEREVLRRHAFIAFPPGAVFHYSNFSIAVADRVIEVAAGAGFGDVLHRSVFSPLGMTDASLGAPSSLPTPAIRYDSGGKRFAPLQPFPRSSRGVNASLHDILKYAAFHLKTPLPGQERILSDSSLDRLHYERSLLPGAHVALAWGSIDIGSGRRWLISSGNDMGVQASLTLLPHARIGVAVLSNVSGYQADEIGIRAADALSPAFAEAAGAAIARHEALTTPFVPGPEWLGAWRGEISTSKGKIPLVMSVKLGGAVTIALGARKAVPVEDLALRQGLMTGVFRGRLPLDEDPGSDHHIELGLHHAHGRLVGFALANYRTNRGKFEIPMFAALSR